MQVVPLPAPYLGVNEKVPVVALQSPFCENLLNFNITQAGVELRKGDSKYRMLTVSGSSSTTFIGMFNFGDTKLFLVLKEAFTNFMLFYDAETGALVYTSVNSVNTLTFSTIYFKERLYFFGDTNTLAPGLVWDGSTISSTGFSGTGLSPIGGNTFKNRIYLIQIGEAAFWYGGIDAVTGAVIKRDLSGIINRKATLSSIASVTITEQTASVVLQCFIFSSGEILFYSGSYPDSADWTLVRRGQVGQPVATNSVVSYEGDSILMCDTGAVSLREVFLKSSQKTSNSSLTDPVRKSWGALVQGMRTLLGNTSGPITSGSLVGNIRAIYDTKNDRIIFSFPFSPVTNFYGSFFFIYHASLDSWSFHSSTGNEQVVQAGGIKDMVFYKNKVLLASYNTTLTPSVVIMVYEKEGSSGFVDRNSLDTGDNTYSFKLKSAPISNNRASLQSVKGMDLIIESDLYATTNYTLIKEFGVQTTNTQSTIAPTGLQKPYVNLGIDGSYIQYEMSGATAAGKTVGVKLYSTNIWKEDSIVTR